MAWKQPECSTIIDWLNSYNSNDKTLADILHYLAIRTWNEKYHAYYHLKEGNYKILRMVWWDSWNNK